MNKIDKVDVSELLSEVTKPSRYIGLELNSFNNEFNNDNINFCFAFPDVYEVGFSHLGLKILYSLINECEDSIADRVYAPWPDMGELMKKNNKSLFGVETKVDIKEFDVIGFTMQTELNFSNIIYMLDIANIPYYAKDRKDFPLIIGGGPSITNPEPLADIFDAILIGEGEDAIIELKDLLRDNRQADKNYILKELAMIKGWFVPSVKQEKVEIRKYWDFSKSEKTHKNQLIPWQQATHDRYVAEIMRGCSRGCRFCHAGYFYRPVREKSPAIILQDILTEIKKHGWQEINLSSLSSSDYSCVRPLLKEIYNKLGPTDTKASLPSLRVDTLDDDLIKLVEKLGKTGLTIAPEAGSQRMRDVINKNISEQEIFEGIETALRFNWQLVKLYFMIGLPSETEDDIDAIIKLVEDIIKISGKKLRINVTVSPFVQKPFTPFQWNEMLDRKVLLDRALKIKHTLSKYKFVKIKYHEIESSVLEAIFARGDRKLSSFLIRAYENGAFFDGWREYFDYSIWEKTADELGININEYLRKRGLDEVLPWDYIDIGVKKDFLLSEYEKSIEESTTKGCLEYCTNCGICNENHTLDFATNTLEKTTFDNLLDNKAQAPDTEVERKYFRVYYQKTGVLRYVGHLDLMRMIYRIVRKSSLSIMYTQGFNHHPKVKLCPPLSLGLEGLNEFFEIQSNTDYSVDDVYNALNFVNYDEMKILKVLKLKHSDKRNLDSISEEILEIIPPEHSIDKILNGIKEYEKNDSWIYVKEKKGKIKEIDLKDSIKYIRLVGNAMRIKKRMVGSNIFTIMEEVFDISREETGAFKITRLEIIIPNDPIEE